MFCLVETYAAAAHQGGDDVPKVLWEEFGTATVGALADSCRVLAMLWDSAWAEGNGKAIADDLLKALPEKDLKALYQDQLFLPSLPLDEISPMLRLGLL